MYKLAVAKPEHIAGILALTVKAFSEGPEGSVVNVKKMERYVAGVVNDSHLMALVALSGTKVLGVALGDVAEHAYCDGLVASDTVIYVDKALRGSNAARDLITAYSKWCDRIPNLLGSTLGISQLGPTTQYLDSVYRELGYRKVGITYMRTGI